MKPLIFIGGGGHCKSVIEAAESQNTSILGILDMPRLVGTTVLGYSVLGTDNDISSYVDKAEFIISIGQIKNANLRMQVAKKIA